MNTKLNKQVNSITDVNPDYQQQKRIAWLKSYQNRRSFLEDLVKEMEGMEFESAKEKSNYYSWAVTQFDKVQMEVF